MEKVAFRSGNYFFVFRFSDVEEYLHPEITSILLRNDLQISFSIKQHIMEDILQNFIQSIYSHFNDISDYKIKPMYFEIVDIELEFERKTSTSYNIVKINNMLNKLFGRFKNVIVYVDRKLQRIVLRIKNPMNKSKNEFFVILTLFTTIINEAVNKKYLKSYSDIELNNMTGGLYNKVINDQNQYCYKTIFEQFGLKYKPMIYPMISREHIELLNQQLDNMYVNISDYCVKYRYSIKDEKPTIYGLYDSRFPSEYFSYPNKLYDEEIITDQSYKSYTPEPDKEHKDFGFLLNTKIFKQYTNEVIDAIKRTYDETLEFHRKLQDGLIELPFTSKELETKKYMLYNLYKSKTMVKQNF